MELTDLPVPHITPGMRGGRCPFDGYTRSLALTQDAGYARDGLIAEDREFQNAYRLARSFKSPVLDANLANLFLLVKFYLPRLVGCHHPCSVVELGVANGGSLLFLASLASRFVPNACVVGVDTFSSFPDGAIDPGVDWHSPEDFAHAEDGIDRLNTICAALDVTLQKRRFGDGDLCRFPPIALCHIDADTREGVEAAFRESIPYMMSGGYWVFDDPLHSTCLGAMEAIEDVVIREQGLNCEQACPQFVFRAR